VQEDKAEQQGVDQDKGEKAQPDAAEHGQPGQRLRHPDGEGVGDAGGKTAAGREQGHGDAGQGIPAQGRGEGDDDRDEGNDLLEGTDEGAHRHEEKDEHGHQAVADGAETADDLFQHVMHESVFGQRVEHAPQHEQEDDDGDEGRGAVGTKHEQGGEQPFPQRQPALYAVKSGVRVDDRVPVRILYADIFPARDDESERVGHDHQDQDGQDLIFHGRIKPLS